MNFNLSEEQTMIQDSIARFVQDNYAYDQRNAVVVGFAMGFAYIPDEGTGAWSSSI